MTRTPYLRPLDFKTGRIELSHGAGGRASAQLVDELFVPAFDNEWLRQGNDQAVFAPPPELQQGGRLVMSTDAAHSLGVAAMRALQGARPQRAAGQRAQQEQDDRASHSNPACEKISDSAY